MIKKYSTIDLKDIDEKNTPKWVKLTAAARTERLRGQTKEAITIDEVQDLIDPALEVEADDVATEGDE